jgi:hypothetical protein
MPITLLVVCLVACCAAPQAITQDRTGHKDPVRGALYNSAFAVIVSVDEAGTTCVWNLQVSQDWMQEQGGLLASLHAAASLDASAEHTTPVQSALAQTLKVSDSNACICAAGRCA